MSESSSPVDSMFAATPDTSSTETVDRPIDCLIRDLEAGQVPARLRTPHFNSEMTSLSKESLVPAQITPRKLRLLEDLSRQPSGISASSPTKNSDYSSSVYSEHSSNLVLANDSTFSSFEVETLRPKPLDLSDTVLASLSSIHEPRTTTVASDISNNDSEEALVKEIVRYPMVAPSPTHRLTKLSPQCGSNVVSEKAARLLGMDGAG